MDLRALFTNLLPLLSTVAWAVGAYLALLWAASVLWAYRDVRDRSENVLVQVLLVMVVLVLPFGGVLLHLILRPRQTLAEKYERSLEEEYLRRDLDDPNVCPHCQRSVEPDFIVCPHCHTSLRRRCQSCERVIDLTWPVCPYCGDDGSGQLLRAQLLRRLETQPMQPHEKK